MPPVVRRILNESWQFVYLGMAYLGTQGDVWDAHKDIALASLGALIAMLITGLVVSRFKRDFAREWAESLRVKHQEPLGEVELHELARSGRDRRAQPGVGQPRR